MIITMTPTSRSVVGVLLRRTGTLRGTSVEDCANDHFGASESYYGLYVLFQDIRSELVRRHKMIVSPSVFDFTIMR